MPYIYSQAWRVTNEGYTMMRGLAMDFPKDPHALEIPDQFMFGPAFLVNPVTKGVIQSEELVPAEAFTTPDGKPGLKASWFSDQNLTVKVGETTDQAINFQWSEAPRQDMPADHFSVRWDGHITAPKNGTYDIITNSDDGVRLWLDDKLIIDDWTSAPSRRNAAKFIMEAGKRYNLRLEFMENIGGAHVSLYWVLPKDEVQSIPSRSVYLPKTPGGWYDFWTGVRLPAGKQIDADAPLEIMPLYVKAGSIVPMGPFLQYAAEKPADPIELRVYVGADGQTIIYEDDGESYNYEKGQYAIIPIRWDDDRRSLTIGAREGTYPSMLQTRSFRVVLVSSNYGTGLQPEVRADRVIHYNGKAQSINFAKTR
ncbi:MAG: PA14 domain-containing protein [Armatimonadota bacterium]